MFRGVSHQYEQRSDFERLSCAYSVNLRQQKQLSNFYTVELIGRVAINPNPYAGLPLSAHDRACRLRVSGM
jgi:hypothetical protein